MLIETADFRHWRRQARELLEAGAAPHSVQWKDVRDAQRELFAEAPTEEAPAASSSVRVPRRFLELAETVALHRDLSKWERLYRTLYRLTQGERRVLEDEADDDVRELLRMAQAVGRDIHKMRAFVRFRRVDDDEGERYVAWHRPDHLIVERNAPFFVDRFGSMRWAILTPDRCAFWDGERLTFGPGVSRAAAPAQDELEQLWRSYYAAVFNPARVKLKAMRAEMPTRHWATLPETAAIPNLLRDAERRVQQMAAEQPPSAAEFVPANSSLDEMKQAIDGCRGCDLYENATQAVFGEGPPTAEVIFVGEQPGDQEDRKGLPFIGPAGRLLDRALVEAEIDRKKVYVTNAVKHFKWEPRGKWRLHKTPSAREIAACRPWVQAEIAQLRPKLIVCLGATAAQSMYGRVVRVTQERGSFERHPSGAAVTVTVHPSALLRARDEQTQASQYELFLEDLRRIRAKMEELSRPTKKAAAGED